MKQSGSPQQIFRHTQASPVKPNAAIPSNPKSARNAIDSILAVADARRIAAKEKSQKEIEARKRRIEALENSDEADEELENPMNLLDSIPIKPSVKTASERLLRNARSRHSTASDTNRPQPPAKRLKSAPNGFDRLIAEERRDRRKGIDGAAVERVLDLLNRAGSVQGHGDIPYPTPDSERDLSNEPEDTMDFDLNVNTLGAEVLDGSAIGAMMDDVRRSNRGAERNVSRRSLVLTGWQGFWDGPETLNLGRADPPALKIKGVHPILAIVKSMADAGDVASLSVIITSGLTEPILRDTANVIAFAEYLLFTALSSSGTSGPLAIQSLIHLVNTAASHPFTDSPALLSTFAAIWLSMGARGAFVPTTGFTAQNMTINSDRQTASGLICGIMRSSAENGWLSSGEARSLVHVLLLLIVDPSSAPALRRSIENTLLILWPLCLSEASAIELGMSICAVAEREPLPVRAQILLAVGQRSEESREISRWVAIGLLIPGSFQNLSRDLVHIVPRADALKEGAQIIYELLTSRAPDHEAISELITVLGEALSDIYALVEITSDPTEVEDIRDTIRTSGDRIKIRLSNSLEGQNKARLSQLDTVIRMQLEVAMKRRHREQRKQLRHIAVEEGRGGQTRLSFGPREENGRGCTSGSTKASRRPSGSPSPHRLKI